MLPVLIALLSMLYAVEPSEAGPRARCVPPRETREIVERFRLQPPAAALFAARRAAAGELLAARLCERGGGYVYMLHMLGRDGHVRRVLVDARTAEVIGNR